MEACFSHLKTGEIFMKMYRVGIIGCGAIFIMHAYPLHRLENTEIKAVCDIKPEALKSASALFQCDGYEDYKELLKRDDIDVVHILTPHYLHAQMAIDAANAGKHVLIEKPMAISMDEAYGMIEAGKRNHVTIGVISQNRYNDAAVAIKKALTDGSLGKVISQRVILSWAKPADYYKNSDWRGTWDKEGGALLIDQSIHVMDLARWFIDEEIESVQASIANRNHPDIETEDTAEGLITYRSGVKTVFFATNNFGYNAPVVVETQCENGTALMEFDRAVISYRSGRELTVVNDPANTINEEDYKNFFNEETSQTAMRTLQQWGVVMFPMTWKSPKSYWGVSHIKQIENYYASLQAGVQPDITADVAIKSQELIMAIYQSAKENRTVRLHG
jgi:UDP-N-acetyl-2-amino-2-deoxyglucuronate dehydrogenase